MHSRTERNDPLGGALGAEGARYVRRLERELMARQELVERSGGVPAPILRAALATSDAAIGELLDRLEELVPPERSVADGAA